jgi:hypothetical protein
MQYFVPSDGVVAIGAGMEHIVPFIYEKRNPTGKKTEKAESTSKNDLKSTDASLSRSDNFCIAVRTSRPDRIWSCHLSHLFRVFETKFSDVFN